MKNLLKSASVAGIIFGLGLVASSAMAQQTADGSKNTSQSSTSGSYDGNSFSKTITADNGNNQSTNVSKDNGNDESSHLAISKDNGNNQSTNVSKDNGNDQSTHLAVSKDNGNNQSTNINKDDGNDQSTHLAFNKDDGNNQSTNNSDNTSTTIGNITVALGYGELSGSVSGQSFKAGDGGSIASGALRLQGNTMQGFAGINNASYITGQGSLGQAMNSVTATSSVTFQ